MASRHEHIGWLALTVLGAVAVVGGAAAISLRLGMGGGHAPYSTFRTDPLGASVIYEAIARLPGVTVERNVEYLDRLAEANAKKTLVVAGVPAEMLYAPMDCAETEAFETFLLRGGRVVILLAHGHTADNYSTTTNDTPRRAVTGKPKSLLPTDTTNAVSPLLRERHRRAAQSMSGKSADELWGIRLESAGARSWVGITNAIRTAAAPKTLPADLPLASLNVFGDVATNGWTVLYERQGRPVVVERRRFKGTIVFCSDSYAICNEGVWRHRRTGWLAWLVGENSGVIFDETHLGSVQKAGLMGLVRRLRMQGFFIALVVLGVLVFWREAMPLAPPVRDEEQSDLSAGRDSQAGLISLLRRSVKPYEAVCYGTERWLRTVGRHLPGTRRERIEHLLQAKKRSAGYDAAALHRQARDIANERD
jgi:hypothetical protein